MRDTTARLAPAGSELTATCGPDAAEEMSADMPAIDASSSFWLIDLSADTG